MGLNELRIIIIFITLWWKYCWLFNLFVFQIKGNLFSFKLPITQNSSVNYAFVSSIEIFIFFSLLDHSRNLETLKEYYYFYGNMVICKNSIGSCSLYNTTQLETLDVALIGMSCLKEICTDSGSRQKALRN